jgi:hypothetical protein
MNIDGSQPRQLVFNARRNRFPHSSADNRYIVFSSNRTGHWQIWRVDRDGRNPKQLTDGGFDTYPDCSPDGQWVIYSSNQNHQWGIWKVSIEGGATTRLADSTETCPLVTMPFDGGDITSICDFAALNNFSWTRDGLAFIYISRLDHNFWMQPISGRTPKKIVSLTGDGPIWHDISRDGKEIFCIRNQVATDLVLITNLN